MLSNMILIPQGKLSSLRGRLRPGRAHAPEGSPSLRAGGLSEPEAGAEPDPAATLTLPHRQGEETKVGQISNMFV